MANNVLQHCRRKISQWEEPDFFLEIDFQMNKTLHRQLCMGEVSTVTIF